MRFLNRDAATSAVHLAPFSRAPQNLIRILKFQESLQFKKKNILRKFDDNKDRERKNISAGHRTFPDYNSLFFD